MSALALTAALALAQQCAPTVAPLTMLAVAKHESGLVPTAIHDNTTGRTYAPNGMGPAAALASRLIRAGHSVDLGIVQINNANLSRLDLGLADVFDPCRSMAAGARVLAENYHGGGSRAERQTSLRLTLSAYNAGPRGRYQHAYVRGVQAAAQIIVPAIEVAGGSGLPVPPDPPLAPVPCTEPSGDGWHVTVAPDCHPIQADGQHVAPSDVFAKPKAGRELVFPNQ